MNVKPASECEMLLFGSFSVFGWGIGGRMNSWGWGMCVSPCRIQFHASSFQIEQVLNSSPVSSSQHSHIIPGYRADTFSPHSHHHPLHGHGRGGVTLGTGEAESWLGRGQLPWMALASTSSRILIPRYPSFSQDRDSAACFLGLTVFVCHPVWCHSLTVTPLPTHLSPEENLFDMNSLLLL